jgi:hypothetical protein
MQPSKAKTVFGGLSFCDICDDWGGLPARTHLYLRQKGVILDLSILGEHLLNRLKDMRKFSHKILLAAALVVGGNGLLSAQGVRQDVILEVATGTWCQYCPGAAMGADELAAGGANVGVVEHHNGDVYTTPATDARNTYYNVQGFPTAWFDGGNELVGGSHTQTLFPSYQQRYNTAMAAPTPFDLDVTWIQVGPNIEVTVHIDQPGAYSAGNLRMQAALTESEIMVNWQGMNKCDFVNRAMYPDANGTAITISQGGPTVTQTFSMAIDPGWVQQEMELVVWIENSSTHEIFNGKMLPLSVAANAVDVAAITVNNVIASQSCATDMVPEIVVRNMGNDPLTAATITYDVNGVSPTTFNWTGNVAYYDFATITLPNITFTPQANNVLTVTIAVPSDASVGNDGLTKTWAEASTHNAGTYMVRIKPDNYGSEITWDLKSSGGTVLGSGGPYFDGNRVQINVPVVVPINDCFTFSMYDGFGDGICCGGGNGWFRLESPLGDTIYAGGEYGVIDFVDFKTDSTTIIIANTPRFEEAISVFPNPSNGQFEVRFAQPHVNGATLMVMGANGQKVFETSTDQQTIRLDLSGFAAGIYMLRIATENGVTGRKLIKN